MADEIRNEENYDVPEEEENMDYVDDPDPKEDGKSEDQTSEKKTFGQKIKSGLKTVGKVSLSVCKKAIPAVAGAAVATGVIYFFGREKAGDVIDATEDMVKITDPVVTDRAIEAAESVASSAEEVVKEITVE